jgi:hypothetical protein
LVAIILSKFVIVAVMALAAAALGEPASEVAAEGEGGGFGVVLAGASMLALAALAPYVLLRLIPVFEAGLSGDLEGTYRRPTAAVGSPTAGHHVLQSVRAHAGVSHANGYGPSAAGGHPGAAAGADTPDTGGVSTRPGTGSTGSGTGAGSPASGSGAGGAGGAPAGGTVSSGAAIGTGVVAAGVGTVAAGAAGARKAGQTLQAHGDEQRAATAGVRSADGAGTARPAPAPAPAPSAPRRLPGPSGSPAPSSRSDQSPRRPSREEG